MSITEWVAPCMGMAHATPVLLHFDRDGQAFGPYPLEEAREYLKRGQILPTDQAWYEGGPGWVPVVQVPGMIGGMASGAPTPPPPASMPTAPQAVVTAVYSKADTKFNKHFFMRTLGRFLKVNPDGNPEQLFMTVRTGEEFLLYRVARAEQDHCVIQIDENGVRRDKRVDYFNINEIQVRQR